MPIFQEPIGLSNGDVDMIHQHSTLTDTSTRIFFVVQYHPLCDRALAADHECDELDTLLSWLKKSLISHRSGAHCFDSRTKRWKRESFSQGPSSRRRNSSSGWRRSDSRSNCSCNSSMRNVSSRLNSHKVHPRPLGSRGSHSNSS